jgi:uncharacterized protein (DUF362 family)/ferredoxin
MPTVVLEGCESYSQDAVRPAVEKCLSSVLGDEQDLIGGKRVLLKPNLLSAREPARSITTHPSVVGAVIDFFKDRGARLHVGDSPAGAVRGVRRVWENTGMLELCERKGVPLVNFEAGGWVSQAVDGRSYEIARTVMDFDRIVSIPKLKTHILTLLTGAVKNMFGCVPGFRKSALHLRFPRPTAMSRALVDVYSLVKPWVSLIDAIDAMDGDGPSSGTTRHVGLIAAGTDGVALDAVLARLIGIDPLRVPTTSEAYRRGLGEADINRISLVGADVEDVRPRAFAVPANWRFFLVPGIVGKMLERLVWVRPRVRQDKCTGCGDCVAVCAARALIFERSKVQVAEKRCVSCLCCHEACSFGAIEVSMSRLARFVA